MAVYSHHVFRLRCDLPTFTNTNSDTFTVPRKAPGTITLTGLFAIMANNSRFTSHKAFGFHRNIVLSEVDQFRPNVDEMALIRSTGRFSGLIQDLNDKWGFIYILFPSYAKEIPKIPPVTNCPLKRQKTNRSIKFVPIYSRKTPTYS